MNVLRFVKRDALLLLRSDEITKHLNSTASGAGSVVSRLRYCAAAVVVGGACFVALRQAPQKHGSITALTIYNYDSGDWNSSRYRNDDTGFNIDAGLAADIGERKHWGAVGLSGQNLR